MSLTRHKRARVKHPKAEARPLEGAERCPECGALQDLRDKFLTIEFEDKDVECWSCHACGYAFRVSEGQVLEIDQWEIIMRPGTHRVELKENG